MLQVGAKVTVFRGLPLVNFYLGDSFTYKRMWQSYECSVWTRRRIKVKEGKKLNYQFTTFVYYSDSLRLPFIF